jgi:hypothetical protein
LVQCDAKAASLFKEEKKYAALFNTVKALRKNKVQYMHTAVHIKRVSVCIQ